MKKQLPIGIEDFEKIRKEGFYYIDKTSMIQKLLYDRAEVTLFTRPRRFGKSLNLSMFQYFFELDGDKELFTGLDIMKESDLCEKYMGKFPVIALSLKDIDAGSYDTAVDITVRKINAEAARHQYLLDSGNLTQREKELFSELLKKDMSEAALFESLKLLSQLLEKHHGQKVIILIDEYDVPLARANVQNYYDKMILLIRNLFHQVLKTNKSLQMAVLTGCLRISKESVFTGLNNLRVLSVTDVRFAKHFGFTDNEVKGLLEYYGLPDKYDIVREWYDGYQFGNEEIYCPWDVINYVSLLLSDSDAWPENYWSNTSSNDAVKRFIREAEDSGITKREIEELVAGETIVKEIHQELTYQDMYNSIENIWSVLFATGYLTWRGRKEGHSFFLAIPNKEVHEIFTTQIMEWFKENVKKDGRALGELCHALQAGDSEAVEKKFGEYLRKTISIRDTFVRKDGKENFYHGILLGIFGFKKDWIVYSNKESGNGYSDILIEIEEEELGIVLEVKYAQDGNLEKACMEALKQVERNQYDAYLHDEGIENILRYGIACYKKKCRVMLYIE